MIPLCPGLWRFPLRLYHLAFLTCFAALAFEPAAAQQKPNGPVRLDAAEIRRQATQLAELRSLLSDPNPDVRFFTMREAILRGDEVQRSTAIDFGLASNETKMVELAVGGMLANTQNAIIEVLGDDGNVLPGIMQMTIKKFDIASGKIDGRINCYSNAEFTGQLQGTVLNIDNGPCSAALSWSAATGDLRGRMNVNFGKPDGLRNVVWRPR